MRAHVTLRHPHRNHTSHTNPALWVLSPDNVFFYLKKTPMVLLCSTEVKHAQCLLIISAITPWLYSDTYAQELSLKRQTAHICLSFPRSTSVSLKGSTPAVSTPNPTLSASPLPFSLAVSLPFPTNIHCKWLSTVSKNNIFLKKINQIITHLIA